MQSAGHPWHGLPHVLMLAIWMSVESILALTMPHAMSDASIRQLAY